MKVKFYQEARRWRYGKEKQIPFIVDELDNLQNRYYEENEEALYYKNKYDECQTRKSLINSEIEKNIRELREIDPTYEYEIELY